MKDALLKTCPRCGGTVKRLIGRGAGLIFKGSGFYITDYKKKQSEKSGKEPVTKDNKKDKGGKGESPEKKSPEKKSTEKVDNTIKSE